MSSTMSDGDDERYALAWLAEYTELDVKDIEFIAITELTYPDYDADDMSVSKIGLVHLIEHLQDLGEQD
jgi:hypothetical protein